MKTLFSKIAAIFAAIFSPKTSDAILKGIRAAAPYVQVALELSGVAAAIIGGPAGKTVAGVLAVADQFGVQAMIRPDATDAEIGTAVRDAVVAAIRLKYPEVSTADANRAVELAYGAVRG